MHYINLGLLLIIVGLVIGVYVHTDKKINEVNKNLSDKIDANNKALTDRIDRLYDILVHMGFRDKEYEYRNKKAANE